MTLGIEMIGILCFAAALGLLYVARPRGGAKPSFLGNEGAEVLYALAVLFLLSGGVTAMILGFV